MSGKSCRRINGPDAQQNVPQSAGTARGTGGGDGRPDVRWVGQQHLMLGYCGRAGCPGAAADDVGRAGPAADVAPARAVTLPLRPRDLVVRIAPKRPAETAGAAAKAA